MKTAAALAALLAAPALAQEKPVLTVLTYDSLLSEWGPGPVIEQAFEADCACDLRLVAAGDGAALLAQLRLEGEGTEADVVLGLDSNLVAAARASGLFAPHAGTAPLDLPVAWSDDTFVPFDWGWFALVGRADGPAPTDFRALAASDASLVIQDPRSSTPGLGLVLWLHAAYGAEAPAIWEALSDNIVTVTPGWTEAYNLFLEGEADLVLSYTTSPAYHLLAENDATIRALPFAEGHYLQVEVAAKVASTDQPDLADRFLAALLTEPVQSAIPTTNWMYPAVTPATGLPEGFESLRPATTLYLPPEEAEAARAPAVEAWRTALSR
ncbi:thiamine ABC transporter substrate binding subunit [Rubellimicrobium aerolatum]|uniref:Thiamine ABC transporter substrate binding subunit n=1 Tax=Rubellimicrobium aerolatum TaxID=490979 RepID=A0ABW0SD07_9RHOB|nr:thiamine ABC transporter substrate binding subunit [Rubellimicrobium aerolatum]MBP1806152.1 thiamine transport system substrate-binding protein [Rubellimicrobium aerolatum]